MLRGAALLALVLLAGCGTSNTADQPEPIKRYLVYQDNVKDEIWIADVDGSNPHRLVKGIWPEISPDGKWVAYFDEPVGSLYLIGTGGGDPKLLAEGTYQEPTWSPDSERIAVLRSSDQRGRSELVSFDVESGRSTSIMRGDEPWGWSFSPDGTQLVFAKPHGSNSERFSVTNIDLFVTGRDGGTAEQITSTGDSGYPVWGPKLIAFAKLIPHNGWGRHELWTIRPDGTDRVPITEPLPERFVGHGCVGLVPIDWSDDGSELLSAWECEFGAAPVAVDPVTGKNRQLGFGYTISLSANGERALVSGCSGAEPPPELKRVLVYPFEGGKPEVAARHACSASWNR